MSMDVPNGKPAMEFVMEFSFSDHFGSNLVKFVNETPSVTDQATQLRAPQLVSITNLLS